MSSAAVASPYHHPSAPKNMDYQKNTPAQGRKHQGRGQRHKGQQHNMDAFSDSNLPATTPKSKKQPRQRQPSGNPTSDAVQQRTRPLSMGNSAATMTPAKPAYAGPTFHASPAPSALPVPKFFSRSVPAAGAESGLQARMERAEDKTADQSDSSPEAEDVALATDLPDKHRSPLDIFFNADREEKAKRQSSSGFASLQAQLSPSHSRPSSQLEDSPSVSRPRMTPSNSSRDIFAMEMDGADSPSRRTPQPERPGMISNRSHTAPNNVPTVNHDEAEMEAYTRSLKQLLNVQARDPGLSTPDRPQQTSSLGNNGSPFQVTPPQYGQANGTNGASNSLHYGNRNLSPLFQAARHDSPSRPSGLRQQLGYDNTQSPTAHRQYQQYASPPHQHQQHQPPQLDPNSFSRAYVPQQQMSATQPYSSPSRVRQEQPFSPAQAQVQNNGSDQRGVQGLDRPPSGPPDVKSMEENLRRMLKLNPV